MIGDHAPTEGRRPFATDDARLKPIAEKVMSGERLGFTDGVSLYPGVLLYRRKLRARVN